MGIRLINNAFFFIFAQWSRVEAEDKSGIFQQKIKCVFLPPAEEDPYLVNQSAVQVSIAGNLKRIPRF